MATPLGPQNVLDVVDTRGFAFDLHPTLCGPYNRVNLLRASMAASVKCAASTTIT